MKKALSLILALVLCLSLCACGGGNETPETTAPKGTPLTIDNYENYLDVQVYAGATETETHHQMDVRNCTGGDGLVLPDGSTTWYVYPLLWLRTEIEGASPNFNYIDVEFTIKLSVTYQGADTDAGEWKDAQVFEQLVTVKCNIGGNTADLQYFDLGSYLHNQMIEYVWEVVDVAGYVEKA